MSNYTVKCNTLVRLSKICSFFKPTTDLETQRLINTIRLENHNGKCFAIATNHEIAAIEYLGETDQKNGVCHLKLSHEFINQMSNDSLFDLSAVITTVPEIAISVLQTATGYTFNDCCYWFSETIMDQWRSWANLKPLSKAHGAMYWDLHHIELLFAASPSGKIVFPEMIDVTKPITIRDRNFDNWVGLFIPQPDIGEASVKAAILPDWWNK